LPDADRDLRAIIEIMLEYREQLPAGLYPDPDPDYTLGNLQQCHDAGSMLYVLEWDGERAKGCLVAHVSDCYWSPGRMQASDMIFYVRPEYRGSTGGRLLLRMEALCRQHGIASLEMNNVSPEHQEAVDALYGRAGYRVTCVSYQKDL
jgi:GNAT superfamily N-acetyltransferase